MEYDNRGLMALDKTEGSPLLDQLRAILSPAAGSPRTLEQRLASLNEIEQKLILQTAQFVHLAMQMRQATNDKTMDYADLVQSMYRGMSLDKRQLIAELLNETAPLDFVPTPKPPRTDTAISFYNRLEMQVASEEPQQTKTDFLERLTHSESSGDSTAEITIADGRRYVGSLQFGDARLQDYKKATGSSFTQDESKANSTLQAKVAAWHIADIDKTIDGLGINTDGYDRDGLRAVAHLGGKGGMKKFVRSNGEYNPSDELGTSLQDYYDKFAVFS
ncbi:hypothetical protein OAD31_03245 [Planktomarina temperata]|nr:hypothetical protein [Planktomarina temperata]